MTPVLAAGAVAIEASFTPWTAIGIATLFALSFFFSGTETSLWSLQKLDRLDLTSQGPAGRMVDRLIRRGRPKLLATILIGNETVNVALTAVAAALAATMVPEMPWITIFVLTPALVLISEITPKVIAIRYPRRWATLAVWPLTVIYGLLYITGIRPLFTTIVSVLARLFGAATEREDDGLEEQELMVIVGRGAEEGAVDAIERGIIEAVFEFDDLTVERLMTPRPDMFTLAADQPWTDLVDGCKTCSYSRIPLHGERDDDIVGVLLVKDLLRHRKAPPAGPRQLRSLLLPPTFVPATKPADAMLEEFLERRLHMAFVVDEHGTLVGLITLDDLLDALIGDELDESSEEEINHLRPNTLTVKAAIDVDDFAEETGIELPAGDWNTVGGYVFHELGRLPRVGDTVVFEHWTFEIASMEGRRILEIDLVGEPPGAKASQEAS